MVSFFDLFLKGYMVFHEAEQLGKWYYVVTLDAVKGVVMLDNSEVGVELFL